MTNKITLTTINNISIIGKIGVEPKIVETDDKNYIKLSIGTEKPIVNKKTGKVQLILEWHNVMIFDKEIIQRAKSYNLAKGSKVRVEGSLAYRKRKIKDANGETLATVKDAYIFAGLVIPC